MVRLLLLMVMFSSLWTTSQSFLHRPTASVRLASTLKEALRADRVVSQRSGKSRKESFALLKQKRVHQLGVDGIWTPLSGPSAKIPLNATLSFDKGQSLVPPPPPLLLVHHKPKWVLSVTSDPHYGRPCLAPPPHMHPVGRLDYDTSGLILFSSSGPLTQRLLHPKYETSKTYQAVVAGIVDADQLTRQLADGVATSDGVFTAVVEDVQHWADDSVSNYLHSIRNNLPSHYNQTDLEEKGHLNILLATTQLSTVDVTVTEGKYRMVRRLLANCGHGVVSLHRLSLGGIQLGDLEEGATRELFPHELQWAKEVLTTTTTTTTATKYGQVTRP